MDADEGMQYPEDDDEMDARIAALEAELAGIKEQTNEYDGSEGMPGSSPIGFQSWRQHFLGTNGSLRPF